MCRRVTVVVLSVCVSVCLSVCLSVKSHLTSGASVHPENTVTYSAGNGGQKICGVFSETEACMRIIVLRAMNIHAEGSAH